MTNKLISLLLTLMLFALPALAEEAGTVTRPTTEDLLGRWEVVYAVHDGTGEVRNPDASYIIISEDVLSFYNGDKLYTECTYLLEGDLLKIDTMDESLQWVGEGVMLFRDPSNPQTLGVLHRVLADSRPFLGDWEVVLCYLNGQPIEPSTTMVTFTETTVEWDLSESDDRIVHPAVYQDGGCAFGSQFAVIDPSGAMIVTGGGEVVVLLPILY